MNPRIGAIRMAWLAVAGSVLLVGCTGDSSDSGDPGGSGADATDDGARPTASPASTTSHLEGTGDTLAAGTYQFSVASLDPPAPEALVAVPDGYEDGDDWYVVSTDGDLFLGLWTAETVEADACLVPQGDDLTPGPTVEELASALVAQEGTDATEPVPVSLDGHQGQYLELTGPSNLGACDEGPALAEARGIYGDSQVDRLWILDVDGRRLVVDASYAPTTTTAERDSLTAMVESIEFVPTAS